VLPFVFNPMLLLIDVRGWWEVVLVSFAAIMASLAFAAASLGWFHSRCRWWEIVLLLVGTFGLFRPDYFMDKLYDPYPEVPAKEIFRVATELEAKERLVLVIKGTNIEGEDVRKTVAVQMGDADDGRKRLAAAGLTISALGDDVRVLAVRFGSRAKKSGFEQGFEVAAVKVPTDRPSEHWVYIPALALVAFVYFLQRSRDRRRERA
jgi:Domain of unknown function (DUF3394)